LGVATAVLANWLLGTGLGATLAVAIEEAIHALAAAWQATRIGAAVAQLTALDNAVATFGHCAGLPRLGASSPGFELAGTGAAIAAHCVAVVAGLAPSKHTIAAQGRTRLARHAAHPAGFDRHAVGRAAVATHRVAVVARFVGGQDTVAAFGFKNARLSPGGACIAAHDLACLRAAAA
jgi:hypothetical protein